MTARRPGFASPPPSGPPWWRAFARRAWKRAMALPKDLPQLLATAVANTSRDLGLVVVGDCSATELAIPAGLVTRAHTWIDVPNPSDVSIAAAAGAMLRDIVDKHGPGRVWTLPLLEIVHLVYDDGRLVKLDDKRRPAVRLRACYFHEAAAVPREVIG